MSHVVLVKDEASVGRSIQTIFLGLGASEHMVESLLPIRKQWRSVKPFTFRGWVEIGICSIACSTDRYKESQGWDLHISCPSWVPSLIVFLFYSILTELYRCFPFTCHPPTYIHMCIHMYNWDNSKHPTKLNNPYVLKIMSSCPIIFI